MPFEIEDLFGEGIKKVTQEIHEENEDLYKFLLHVKSDAFKMGMEVKPNNRVAREMVAACFYMRTLEASLTSTMLIMRGLVPMATVIARTIFEAMVHLRLSAEDENYPKEFLESNLTKSMKYMARDLDDKNSIVSKVFGELPFDKKQEFENMKNAVKSSKTVSMKKLAKRAGLKNYYDVLYSHFSSDVHVGPGSLARYFILDENGAVTALRWSYDNREETPRLLMAVIEMRLHNMLCVNNIFQLSFEPVIADHNEKKSEMTKHLN